MGIFKINKIINNQEIISKIANSLVKNKECKVKFNPETGKAEVSGENYCSNLVDHELCELFKEGFEASRKCFVSFIASIKCDLAYPSLSRFQMHSGSLNPQSPNVNQKWFAYHSTKQAVEMIWRDVGDLCE